jgi:hypothetical protein
MLPDLIKAFNEVAINAPAVQSVYVPVATTTLYGEPTVSKTDQVDWKKYGVPDQIDSTGRSLRMYAL